MLQVIGKIRIQHADTGVIYEIDGHLINLNATERKITREGVEIKYSADFNHPQLGHVSLGVWKDLIRTKKYDSTKYDYSVGRHKLLEDVDINFTDFLEDNDEYRQERINSLTAWFHKNYKDLDEGGLYYESKAGGYVGDIRDASEELQGNFPDVPYDIIELAVEEIESGGDTQWTPAYRSEESLIDDALNALIDNAPKPKTAPAFALRDDNRFHITLPPDSQPVDNQNNSPKGLRTTIDKLLESLKGSNGHQDLIPIIEDYKEVISGDEISISDLHWQGIILGNMVHAINRGIEAKEQPSLPLKTEAYLNSALDLHHTYMMLDEKGQRLMNAGDYRKSAEQIEGLKDAIGQLSNIITESRDLLGEDVRKYVSNVLKDMGQGQHPERSNQSIGNILTNLVSGILGWIKRSSTQTITDLVINKAVEGVLGADAIAIGTVAINGALLLVSIAPLLLIIVAPFAGELSWLASTTHLLERIRLAIKSD